MPNVPPSPCRHPGCRELVPIGAYCPKHVRNARADSRHAAAARRERSPSLSLAHQLRRTGIWQDFRIVFVSMYPLCCDPFDNHCNEPALTQSVHHIERLEERPDLLCVSSNCRPVCNACHAILSAIERRGQSTAYLFNIDHWLKYLAIIGRDMLTDVVYCEMRKLNAPLCDTQS